MANCNFCNSKDIKLLNLNYKFITSDIKTTSLKPKTFICLQCNLVQKDINKNYLKGINQIYKNYDGFEKYNQIDQTKFIGSKIDTRCNVIYKALFKNTNSKSKRNILDFGCSSGAMIGPLLENKNNFNVYGTDVKNHLDKTLIKNKKFKKFIPLKSIYNCKVKFDYIFLIHVFEHLTDLNTFLLKISGILAKDGKVIIQIPNYNKNPYDLLIYDHAYHFDETSLKNILNFYSYNFKINDELIQGEYFISASPSKKLINQRLNSNFKNTLNKLNWLKKTFSRLKKIHSFSIIGSSVTSLIIISNFYKKIINVYDEDPNRVGKIINRVKITSMSYYNKEKIFFPFYGLKLENIKSRFNKKYHNLKII